MFYAKFESPDGDYIDAGGRRYDVSVVRRVRCSRGVNVGYEEFPTLEAALEHWGLVRVALAISDELLC